MEINIFEIYVKLFVLCHEVYEEVVAIYRTFER
jgi:hypothetical protein